MKQLFTIGQVISLLQNVYDNPKALATHRDDGWKTLSSKEFASQIRHMACGLLSLGIKKGDKVGIIALPSAEWTIADYAIMAIGAVSVPLFANISEENFYFEVKQTGLKTVFVGGIDQWIRSEKNSQLFDHIIGLDPHASHDKTISYEDFIQRGKQYESKQAPNFYEELLNSIDPKDVATIIYTSGSTGVPKGAVHTHHSLTSLLNTPIFNWDNKKDCYLNFLPVAHVFARVLNLIMTSWGISCYYYNDVKTLGVACQEVHPTVMVVVPRLLEKMYSKMLAKIEEGSFIKRWIGRLAFSFANQKEKSFLKTLFFPLMDKLVYSKLRAALGGNMRVVFSGGAALSPALYHFFLEIGFPIYEGWGLTEACPITVNVPGKIKIGTVGAPIPGMHVKTAETGELFARGEMMMNGYYENPEATALVIDQEGWLHTGDKGSIDSDGYVTIIGRLKELFKSSTGEWIAPIPIEQALGKAPFIDAALVIAENKKFASCLLVPDFDALQTLKKKEGALKLSDEEFLMSPFIKNEMKILLENINRSLDEWAQIKDYRFILHPLSIEEGELTPSMKIKRDKIERKYKELIDAMYV